MPDICPEGLRAKPGGRVLNGGTPAPVDVDHVTGKTPPVTATEALYFELASPEINEVVVIESNGGGATEIVYAWLTASGGVPLSVTTTVNEDGSAG